jgi:hypothetical protein
VLALFETDLTMPQTTSLPCVACWQDFGERPWSTASKRVAIVQSNYIPWKGYFDLIRHVDEFILYDDVQYTRRDWRNRNRIKSANGVQWLTVPVQVKGKYFQAIKDTVVSDDSWRRTHWMTLSHCYGKSPYFRDFRDRLEALYLGSSETRLSEINFAFLRTLCEVLGIATRITWSMDYACAAEDPTDRLVELCRRAGADAYLSGPAAKAYIREDAFRASGITLAFMDYSGYPEYPQMHPPFDHFVTVLDLLFMTGPSATAYLRHS